MCVKDLLITNVELKIVMLLPCLRHIAAPNILVNQLLSDGNTTSLR